MCIGTCEYPEAVSEIDETNWVLYRCPHCNAWDYALQGSLDKPTTLPPYDVYTCDECGEKFMAGWLGK